MRILYWLPAFLPDIGGIEVLSAKTLPALRNQGHEFAIITSFGNYPEIAPLTYYEGIPVNRFDFRQPLADRNLPMIIRLRNQVLALKREFSPDLIHIHFSDPFVYFHLSTRDGFPCPSIVTVHMSTAAYRGDSSTLLGKLIRTADWVTGVSKDTLHEVLALAPEIKSRTSVIYNGLDSPSISPSPLPFSPPRLLYLGRLIDFKGCHLAIEACAALQTQFPGLELIVAGDGPEFQSLVSLARERGIFEQVQFTGWIDPDDVPALINQTTVVLIPSTMVEGLPLVAIQAGQMARPAIASSVGGIPEIIQHGHTGYIVPPGELDALINQTIVLLTRPDLAQELGQNARQFVQENFGMDAYIRGFDTLYRRIGESNPVAPAND